MSAGSTFYCYGLFVKPLAAEFEASRLASVLGLTLLILIQGAVAPLVGRALDRRPVRGVMTAGALLLAAGLACASFARELWQVGVVFASAIAVGGYMFGPLATATLVARWFVRGRGKALGWTSLGGSLGGVAFPPFVALLVERHGWRGAALALSGIVLATAIPLSRLVTRPEDLGLQPDGAAGPPASQAPAAATPARELTPQALLRSRNFWAITASIGLVFAPVNMILAHLIPYASDLGIAPTRAATLMSAYALAGGFGRVGFGSAADRIDKRLAIGLACATFLLGWCALLGQPGFARLLFASAVLGLSVGGIMPLWGALVGACFGRAVFGRAIGLMNPMMLPFNLAGAPLAAWLYDESGSYALALACFLLPPALALLSISLLRIPEVEPG